MVLAHAATAPVAVIANLGGMHSLRFQRLDHAQVVTVQAEMHAWQTTKMRRFAVPKYGSCPSGFSTSGAYCLQN
jgi:hypothetical protein